MQIRNAALSHLEPYIGKTKDLRKDQNLLIINFVGPQKCIITSVTVLKNVGVDVTVV